MRPGDTLSGRSTVTRVRPSSKNPDRGTVFTLNEVFNQDGVLVLTMKARGFFARRSQCHVARSTRSQFSCVIFARLSSS